MMEQGVNEAMGTNRRESSVLDEVEMVAVPDSPIYGFLDAPLPDSTVAGALVVRGWVASTTTPIARVEALLNGRSLGTVAYGTARPDVAAAYPDTPPQCGYHTDFSPDVSVTGDHLLIVRVTGDDGATRDFARHIFITQPVMRLHLESPHAQQRSAGGIEVSGWALSLLAPIASVETFLGSQPLGAVPHGFPRPDVHAALKHPRAMAAGFWGTVTFGAGQVGETIFTVRVRDILGNEIEAVVPVQISTPEEPDAAIERAILRSGTLEVEGWALLPRSASPRVANLFIDDRYIGQARIHLSRPDIRRRFPNTVEASQSGFQFRQPYAPPERGDSKTHTLSVECVDADGRRVQRRTHLVHEDAPSLTDATHSLRGVAAVIEEYQRRMAREPIILDWHTGLHLTAAFPRHAIFVPPTPEEQFLPYADASIDVVVATGDAKAAAEARRVAESAVVIVARTGQSSGTDLPARASRAVMTEWKDAALDQPSPFTWSIVIPVHNKAAYTLACLAQLQVVLPAAENVGEIIVVDDASIDDTPGMLARARALDPRIRALRNSENQGFLASCNRGASAASGDIIVFLNNDTLPQPGWLGALLMLFRAYPDAGTVGSKLIYPDVTLQEAGGVIFSDGSGCNFGRGDVEIDAPLYNHVREVDYCSGASLATRREIFDMLGGFDTRFAPAYYEDVDYCFQMRAHGYRVYYQPESVVIHCEGVSSGTDITRGVKSYQVVNQRKFVEKWRDTLREQPSPPDAYNAVTWHALAVRGEGLERDANSHEARPGVRAARAGV